MTQEQDTTLLEDPTAHLNAMRRTTKEIFTYGASEERGLLLANQFSELDTHLDAAGATPGQWRNIRRGRPREEEDGEILDNVTHGTRSGYNRGCHCQKCRKANREHAANRRATKKG